MIKEKLMRDVYVNFVREQILNGDKVVALEADLAKCSGMITLQKEFPDRVINVGIAEQNMASVAAGLSAYGFIPFIHSFGPFVTRRICDQLMISICYAKQNVKIIGSDPGITAELNGGTHMPLEDIGVLRSIPNIVIYEPTDNVEFEKILPQVLSYNGPVYVRMFRKIPPSVFDEEKNEEFDLFKAKVIKSGSDVTIVAAGIMVSEAIKASEILEKSNISVEVIASPTIKPIDKDTIIESVKKTGLVVTAENHNVCGGLRSAVAEVVSENYPVLLHSIGVKEKFGEVGKQAYLKNVFKMNATDIADEVIKAIEDKRKLNSSC
ncbi:MAG: transketolase family protein [Christensenellaceae bacterium]|jgi:transketolase|nr:transketolase family protein [Christensenellaceae bacterium]